MRRPPDPRFGWLSRGFVALTLAHASPAFAEDRAEAFSGTTRHAVALEATLINAQVFGAVRALDRIVIRPPRNGYVVAGFESNWIWGATEVPAKLDTSKGYVLADVDLFANNAAIQACTTESPRAAKAAFFSACAFYSSSVSVTWLPLDQAERAAASLVSFTGPLIYGHGLAPLSLAGVTQGRAGLNSIQFSVIGGAAFELGDWMQGRAGFVGSREQRGLYGNLYSPRIKAFLTAALRDQLRDIATLMGGVDGLDLLNFGAAVYDARSSIGQTVAYFRQTRLAAPQLRPDPDQAVQDIVGEFDFVTYHFGQKNVASNFDVLAAVASSPQTLIHEAQFGYHTVPNEDDILGVWGGVTQLPELPYYGVSGGLRPFVRAEVGRNFGSGMKTNGPASTLKYSLRFNDPETLTYFPFAQNAFNMYFIWSGAI